MLKIKAFVYLLLVALSLSACHSSVNEDDIVQLEFDQIPTLQAIINKEKDVAILTSQDNELDITTLNYHIKNVSKKELFDYFNFLRQEEQFIVLTPLSQTADTLSFQLTKPSTLDGKLIIVDALYINEDPATLQLSYYTILGAVKAK